MVGSCTPHNQCNTYHLKFKKVRTCLFTTNVNAQIVLEAWSFFEGTPLTIYILDPFGSLIDKRLGRDFDKGESFQVAIEAGSFFAAEQRGPGEFTLVGCTVAPGFEHEDMEIAGRAELLAKYPQHRGVIEKFTLP
ncbi:MAG TPA: cupin domain-containing protein [Syntrophobacteraceae bacterium]|nr:cupin domain-containing protein [Syntrophobacteraceae bacterium]